MGKMLFDKIGKYQVQQMIDELGLKIPQGTIVDVTVPNAKVDELRLQWGEGQDQKIRISSANFKKYIDPKVTKL